jgi:hypothetical protein
MLSQENDEPHIFISLFSLEYLGKENIRLLYFIFLQVRLGYELIGSFLWKKNELQEGETWTWHFSSLLQDPLRLAVVWFWWSQYLLIAGALDQLLLNSAMATVVRQDLTQRLPNLVHTSILFSLIFSSLLRCPEISLTQRSAVLINGTSNKFRN